MGGVGGTLAGNAMSFAAMRAVLGEVLTDDAFAPMEALATAFAQGVQRHDRGATAALVDQPARGALRDTASRARAENWRRLG